MPLEEEEDAVPLVLARPRGPVPANVPEAGTLPPAPDPPPPLEVAAVSSKLTDARDLGGDSRWTTLDAVVVVVVVAFDA
jgi:hypothetical protein